MIDIIVATKNNNKFIEIKSFFSDLNNINWHSLYEFPEFPDIEENGKTIEENSVIKATFVSKTLKSYALADDTGLFVDYLGGNPGVYSARWAGKGCSYDDNNRKLLEMLRGVEFEKRTAMFKCAITLSFPDGRYITEIGEVSGYILEEKKGENGFGYDPLFYVVEFGKTFAEMSIDEKNRISHRSIALAKIKQHILRLIRDM